MMRVPKLPSLRALLFAFGLTIAGGVVLGGTAVLTGVYNVAASDEHFDITERLIKLILWRSISTQSAGIEVPPLDDPGMATLGARHFATGCEPCHAAPGLRRNPIASGMSPPAPPLREHAVGWSDAELFWTIRHGLKFTGMPQWAGRGRSDEVWPLVAFLRELPSLSPQEYSRLAADPEGADRLARVPETRADIAACVRCHGDAERPPISDRVPLLQGQSAAYLERALEEYTLDRRQSGFMEPLVTALSPQRRAELAGAYASMAMPPVEPTDTGAHEAGRRIATEGLREQNVAACLSCHAGARSPQFPRLAGLSRHYIAQQLRLFRDGVRGDTAYGVIMRSVARRLNDTQIEEVAAYLASRDGVAAKATAANP